MNSRVLIVGTGNLAWHLAPNLQRIGLEVDIWSRKGADPDFGWQSSIAPFPTEAVATEYAAIFLAVPDDHITAVSQRLASLFPKSQAVVHTSGATAVTAISPYFDQRAALWPIRSLRKGETVVPWTDLPLAYHSNDPIFNRRLAEWSAALSELTYSLDDEQRAQLHLAAVFSNNFTTWLCQIAYELCEAKAVPFEALVPIIRNTFANFPADPPALRQTGAAIRGDQKTMQRHLALLKEQPEYAKLYADISGLIGRERPD